MTSINDYIERARMLGLSPKPHIMFSKQYRKWISIVVPPYPGRMSEYEVYRMYRAQEVVDRLNRKRGRS